jgi:hypothetical protein
MSESCNEQALDLVLVGAISKDENIFEDWKESSIGGAVTYGAFSAKRSGSSVGVITKLAEEDHHLIDQLCRFGYCPQKKQPPYEMSIIRAIRSAVPALVWQQRMRFPLKIFPSYPPRLSMPRL